MCPLFGKLSTGSGGHPVAMIPAFRKKLDSRFRGNDVKNRQTTQGNFWYGPLVSVLVIGYVLIVDSADGITVDRHPVGQGLTKIHYPPLVSRGFGQIYGFVRI
jgi:hypothetical protein